MNENYTPRELTIEASVQYDGICSSSIADTVKQLRNIMLELSPSAKVEIRDELVTDDGVQLRSVCPHCNKTVQSWRYESDGGNDE